MLSKLRFDWITLRFSNASMLHLIALAPPKRNFDSIRRNFPLKKNRLENVWNRRCSTEWQFFTPTINQKLPFFCRFFWYQRRRRKSQQQCPPKLKCELCSTSWWERRGMVSGCLHARPASFSSLAKMEPVVRQACVNANEGKLHYYMRTWRGFMFVSIGLFSSSSLEPSDQ